MIVFDIETLGSSANSVVASAGLVHVKTGTTPSFEELISTGLFVKFDIEYQIKVLGRKVDKETVDWWGKQHKSIRDYSIKPLPDDVKPERGLTLIRDYIKMYESDIIWTRGSLDQFVIDDLAKQVNVDLIAPYNVYRDVRTAIDIFTGSKNGYCKVNYPGFESYNVIKHNPVHDSAYDAMQLLYGVSE